MPVPMHPTLTSSPRRRLPKCSPPQIRPRFARLRTLRMPSSSVGPIFTNIGPPCVLGLLGSRRRITTVFTARSTKCSPPQIRRRITTVLATRSIKPRFSSRTVYGLGIVAAVALLAATSASANPSAKTRVTVIGDSITASFEYVPAARRYLGKGLDLRSDAVVCRRLVAASCSFQGSTPATALQVIGAQGRALGPVVVINVGYNDWVAVYQVDRVMRGLRAAGVKTAIWVTLRETMSNYAQSNARIRSAARRWKKRLVVADWNAYSRGKPWFREDGLHLTTSGAMGLARLLRPLVLAGVTSS